MKSVALLTLALSLTVACGKGELSIKDGGGVLLDDDNNLVSNNGGSNNAANGEPNNGTPNNGTPNNSALNNTVSNNTTTNGTPNNTSTNNNTPMCLATEAMCAGACLDVTTNDANCGDCDVVCDGGRVCMEAACQCETGDFCGGACVDTTANSRHCGTCDNACPGGEACISSMCEPVTQVEAALIATNAARVQDQNCGSEGMFAATAPLNGDPELHRAAQAHADDMAANNFFSHTGSDGSSSVVRIGRTNYTGSAGGENIAAGNSTAEATIQQWLNSDGHCRNMMNPSFRAIGIGYAPGGRYGHLWVQVFGR